MSKKSTSSSVIVIVSLPADASLAMSPNNIAGIFVDLSDYQNAIRYNELTSLFSSRLDYRFVTRQRNNSNFKYCGG